MSQIIVRKGSFDSMHRVMNEKLKCFNIHGHTYLYELKFKYKEPEEIGYAIDFKEIKRLHMQFIDDYFDHGAILNPHDEVMITAVSNIDSKYWLMSLNGEMYCNPSVENIAKELFILMHEITNKLPIKDNLKFHSITLYETPSCYTQCDEKGVSNSDMQGVLKKNQILIDNFLKEKGWVEYDDRK